MKARVLMTLAMLVVTVLLASGCTTTQSTMNGYAANSHWSTPMLDGMMDDMFSIE